MTDRARLAMLEQCVRRTPLMPLPHPQLDLYVKGEFLNLFGSSKDRSALWILKRAIERGDVHGESTVLESSSGNFAMAMASLCRLLGLTFLPVIDPNCNATTAQYLLTACDRVEQVTRRDPTGGFLQTRLERVRELREGTADLFWPNQYANLDAMEGHYELTGREIVEDVAPLDYLFVGAGTGGTLAGVSHRVKESWPDVRVVAVDVQGSVIFGGPPGTRHIPGLGSSMRSALIDEAVIDDVVIVSELDSALACHDLLRRYGLHVGGSTGSVFHAVQTYLLDGRRALSPRRVRPRVAFLAADRGTAYASTVFDQTWVTRQLRGGETAPRPAAA